MRSSTHSQLGACCRNNGAGKRLGCCIAVGDRVLSVGNAAAGMQHMSVAFLLRLTFLLVQLMPRSVIRTNGVQAVLARMASLPGDRITLRFRRQGGQVGCDSFTPTLASCFLFAHTCLMRRHLHAVGALSQLLLMRSSSRARAPRLATLGTLTVQANSARALARLALG